LDIPEFKTIRINAADGIAQLILDQPPSNTMTLAFFKELKEAVHYISGTKEIRGLVISGRGRHFSSGTDLSSLLGEISLHTAHTSAYERNAVPEFLSENYQTLIALSRLEIPVIAAIRGVCLGSALELALFSHFRFCGEDAVFALPETTFNLIPGLGGITRLTELSGRARSLELVLQGETFPAEKAFRYGVVDRILPKRNLLQASVGFAKQIQTDYHKEKKRLYLKQESIS
jgi:enoyl-CoA hydratase/carnithine racemase